MRPRGWNRHARHLVPPVALFFVALGLALPVAAAGPPPGVLFDSTVVVSVREPRGDGGAPLAGADVTLVSYINDFDDPLQVLTGTSDGQGRVEVAGVARQDAGGPPVFLAIEAFREVVTTDEAGCVVTQRWFGLVSDLPTPADVEIEVAIDASNAVCPTVHSLRGTILGPSGSTLAGVFASVSMVLPPDGGAQSFPLTVGADGSFSQALPAWGTFENPAVVRVEFVSAPTRFEPSGGDCLRTYAQRVDWAGEYALAEGQDLPVLALVTEEFLVGEQCGATGEGQEPPLAGVTLPPTDASASEPRGRAVAAGAVAAVASLLLLGAVTLVSLTAIRRRG